MRLALATIFCGGVSFGYSHLLGPSEKLYLLQSHMDPAIRISDEGLWGSIWRCLKTWEPPKRLVSFWLPFKPGQKRYPPKRKTDEGVFTICTLLRQKLWVVKIKAANDHVATYQGAILGLHGPPEVTWSGKWHHFVFFDNNSGPSPRCPGRDGAGSLRRRRSSGRGGRGRPGADVRAGSGCAWVFLGPPPENNIKL